MDCGLSFVAEKDTAWKALRLNGFRVLRNLCFCFSTLFQAISEPSYDILTKPCANRGEKRAVRQHSPLSYFSLMICSYSMAYLFSITILLW